MEIITTRIALFLSLILVAAPIASADGVSATRDRVSAEAVIGEMSLARQNPSRYAGYLEELRAHYNGRVLVLPGHTKILTKEGLGAVDEAIRFLRAAQPQPPLKLSAGMSRAAADHCAEQASDGVGHGEKDFSNPASRMNRYGTWGASLGENIAYGKTSARDIVIASHHRLQLLTRQCATDRRPEHEANADRRPDGAHGLGTIRRRAVA